MVWLLIIASLLLIIAPVAWILPTPQQRHQMRLRQQAMSSGARVSLASIQSPDPDFSNSVTAGGVIRKPTVLLARYSIQLQATENKYDLPIWCLLKTVITNKPVAVAMNSIPGWIWCPDRTPAVAFKDHESKELNRIIATLPKDVKGIDGNLQEVGIFWLEKGTADDVREILSALQAIAFWHTHLDL